MVRELVNFTGIFALMVVWSLVDHSWIYTVSFYLGMVAVIVAVRLDAKAKAAKK